MIGAEGEPKTDELSRKVYETLEEPNWAPWLRFSAEEIAEHRRVFPEGQITLFDEDQLPKASLDTVKINWDGNDETLTTWDEVAGTSTSFEDSHTESGNTVALLSMSIRPDKKGEKLATRVIDILQERFSRDGIDHIIGDFRPSGFGEYKQKTGKYDFIEYVTQKREDGLPVDGWLRALTRKGVDIKKPDPRAMVVPVSTDELSEYATSHNSDQWKQIEDPEHISYLMGWHKPELDIDQIDEVWECGETGTWYIDRNAGEAVYIESNIWGEIPLVDEEKNLDYSGPNYDLTPEELEELEASMISQIKDHFGDEEGIYAAWINNSHPYSNIVRTLEANTPEFSGIEKVVDDVVESRSRFYALVDTRNGADRVVHATRISGAVFGSFEQSQKTPSDSSGFIAIDELIESGQGLSLLDFISYYKDHGVNLDTCISVETNFTVGEKTETDTPGIRVSDLGYTALFNLLERKGLQPNRSSVFAFVNEKTKHSLTTVLGIDFEPMVGRKDLKVPGLDGGFDDSFWPVRIPITDKVVEIFTGLKELAAPEVYFK